MTKPYLSVVIVGRNDDYGDDFLGRINTFVRSLDYQVRDYPGVFELVVVEWNPLDDRDPLASVLVDTENLPVRVITVPKELHDGLNAKTPVLEFHGKNVGIRRARGEFVLVSNPDIIFSQPLIDELARKKLRVDRVYRTDRYDFRAEGISDIACEDLGQFAVDNTFLVHGMHDRQSVSMPIDPGPKSLERLPRSDIDPNTLHTNGCGDFILAAREIFFTTRGLYETLEHRWHVDTISLLRFAIAKVRQQVFVAPMCIFHQHHDRKPEDVAVHDLDYNALAHKPGSTDWGFKGLDLRESIKEPR